MPKVSRPHIKLTPDAVEQGYKNCKAVVNEFFKDQSWATLNLPGDRRKGINALMAHLIRCYDQMDAASPTKLPLESWVESRDDVDHCFMDKCTTVELAALADTCRKFKVPRQYLFDTLEGCDWWIRFREIKTFEEFEVLAYRMGGAPLAASVPIMGFVHDGYENSAVRCGKAMFMTHCLAHCVDNAKRNRNYLPTKDLEEFGIEPGQISSGKIGKPWTYFVRTYVTRIEKLFYDGGHLVEFLDFDGVRCLKSLTSYHWQLLMKMKIDPDCVFNSEGVLTKKELFKFKARHVLGMESRVPVIPELNGHH